MRHLVLILAVACNGNPTLPPPATPPPSEPPTERPTTLDVSSVLLAADPCLDALSLELGLDPIWAGETVNVVIAADVFSAETSADVGADGLLLVGAPKGASWPCEDGVCPTFDVTLSAGPATGSTTADVDPTVTSEIPVVVDADGDRFGIGDPFQACPGPGVTAVNDLVSSTPDCDDAATATNPGAIELCDGLDNDCDTQADEDAQGWRDGLGGFGLDIDLATVPDGATLEICGETPITGVLTGSVTLTGLEGAVLTGQAEVATGASLTADGMRWVAQAGVAEGAALTSGGTVDLTAVDVECLTNEIYGAGGAIRATGGSVTLTGGSIGGCFADQGAALYAENNTFVTLDTTEVYLNTATADGGGVRVVDSSLTLDGAVFDQNAAATGGAISALRSGVSLTFAGFTSNTAVGDAGAVDVSESPSPLSVTGCAFTDNVAGNHGGALVTGDPSTIASTQFISNLASADGGAVWADQSVAITTTSLFRDNVALGDGGALWAGFRDLDVADSSFEGNAATGSGGAVYATSPVLGAVSPIRFTNTVLSGNSADAQGGGAYLDGVSAAGITLAATTLTDNVAGDGGALFVVAHGVDVAVDATATDNEASSGNGGVLVVEDAGAVTLTGVYNDNLAVEDGAVLQVDAVSVDLGGTYTSNLANRGAVVYVDDASTATVDGTGTTLSDNVAFSGGSVQTSGAVAMSGITTGLNDPSVFAVPATGSVSCVGCVLPGTDTAVVTYGTTASSPPAAGTYDVTCIAGAACTYVVAAP